MDGQMDAHLFYEVLDAQRRARDLSWRQVAKESGVSPSLLSRMGNGHRPDLDGFIALVQWLGTPAENFFMASPEDLPRDRPEPALETQFALLLRARDDLLEADKQYLLEVFEATMRRIKVDRQER